MLPRARMHQPGSVWKRVLGASIALLIGALGLHAYWRRSPAARCPFGYDVSATPAQRSAARQAFASTHRGTIVARSRAALAWTLDATTRDDVVAWAKASGAACAVRGPDLECSRVAPLSALWLGFDDGGRLVALTAFHEVSSASDATRRYRELVSAETARAGAPALTADQDVARGALMQSSTEWRFTDAWARTTVTNLGHERFVVIDEQRSLR
jgi:hypothetical protein